MSNKTLSIKLFAGFFSVLALVNMARGFSGAGSGTQEDPYIITNVYELQEINDDLDAWYELGNDIDASDTGNWNAGQGFSPVGHGYNYTIRFRGHFDGRGHIISGLYINRPDTDHVGLFGYTSSPEIKDVGLIDIDITGRNGVGGLIGSGYAGSRSRCYTTGRITGGKLVGGLIGNNGRTDLIIDCYSTAKVSGDSSVGGLVGFNSGYSGGTSTNAQVTHCYSAGLVNNGVGSDYVGGLVGHSKQTDWNSCYWDIESSGQKTSAGGLGKTTMEMKWQVCKSSS